MFNALLFNHDPVASFALAPCSTVIADSVGDNLLVLGEQGQLEYWCWGLFIGRVGVLSWLVLCMRVGFKTSGSINQSIPLIKIKLPIGQKQYLPVGP